MRPAFLLSLFALVVVGCGPTVVDGSDRSGAGRIYVAMTLARAEALCRGVGPDSTYSRALP